MAGDGPLFVVAIDFGTTYSGYAYSTSVDFKTDPAKVWANQNWCAGGQGLLSKKTPTCLLLTPEKELHAFGYEAEEEYATLALNKQHHDWYYFKRFKMKLQGEELFEDDMIIEDEMGKPFPALVVFSKSIAYLKQIFEEDLENRDIVIEPHEIRWVLTVPAIWNDSAKRFMRKAAVKAGILSKQLKIALEPEAASFFCQYEKTDRGKRTRFSVSGPGTKYMVIDLGGGTADITVYEKLRHGKLKEIYKASGGAWGGTAVDEAYIQLLTRIVGGPTMHRFRKESMYDYIDMMREFEVTKRSIKPKGRATVNFKIPAKLNEICEEHNGEDIKTITTSPNFPFEDNIRVVGDKLTIDLAIVKQLFKDVSDQILDHVDNILEEEHLRGLSLIVLVGGFSESPLVQEAIKAKYKNEERRVIILQEAGLSVVKGAVIFGHTPCNIQSRILRYTYGTIPHIPFDPKIHPQRKKVKIGERERICIFQPFINAGTNTKIGHTVVNEELYSEWNFKESSVFCVYVSSDPNAKYPDDSGCLLLKRIPIGKILPSLPKQDRKINVEYIFGDTEVEIHLKENATAFTYNDTFQLKE